MKSLKSRNRGEESMWSLSLETSYWLMFKTELLIHRKLHLVIDIWSVLQLNVTEDNLILKNTMK